jgi:anhydro-N-acetylmuramic acid kinase
VTGGYFIGLISGTSRDGVDAALVLFEDEKPRLLHALCLPYGEPLESDLKHLLETGHEAAMAVGGMLDERIGRHFARAARTLADEAGIEMRDIEAIGSHGQTVWHDPEGDPPCSIQLGSPQVLLRSTGVPVVSHFRQADIESGGQGAPLAPLLHRHLFFDETESRAILNLGGIANLTFLHRDGSVSGHDCGPANCLLDLWTMTQQARPFDAGGEWAASGKPVPGLLQDMLADPYFSRPPPKSTGLEYFNRAWLEPFLARHCADPADVQCTLAELTARSVAQALEQGTRAVERLLVCGGGVHNTDLLARLARLLPDTRVQSTRHHGMHPDWVEAVLFAWLARERLAGRLQHTRPITGAEKAVLLGELHRPAAPGTGKE